MTDVILDRVDEVDNAITLALRGLLIEEQVELLQALALHVDGVQFCLSRDLQRHRIIAPLTAEMHAEVEAQLVEIGGAR